MALPSPAARPGAAVRQGSQQFGHSPPAPRELGSAARCYEEALRIDPGLAEPHVNLGNLHHLVSALDLVISIDTAAAHLAGALGKPAWLLLAATPDGRWRPGAGAARKP
jgi:ADP-heptose:LPS heptosyltransferase